MFIVIYNGFLEINKFVKINCTVLFVCCDDDDIDTETVDYSCNTLHKDTLYF